MLSKLQIVSTLKESFFNQFDLQEKRPNLYQIFVPLYHPDGDMFDIFIRILPTGQLLLTDCSLTLMRLSYTFEIDSDKKKALLHQTVFESGGTLDVETGAISLPATLDQLFNQIMQFTQIISKVLSLKLLQRKTTASLFYEKVKKFIISDLSTFNISYNVNPISGDKDISVDYVFTGKHKPIYLFPVNNSNNTKKAIITILSLQNVKIPFTSVLVHENYDSLSKVDRKFSMKVADKQFYDYKSFTEDATDYLTRSLA